MKERISHETFHSELQATAYETNDKNLQVDICMYVCVYIHIFCTYVCMYVCCMLYVSWLFIYDKCICIYILNVYIISIYI